MSAAEGYYVNDGDAIRARPLIDPDGVRFSRLKLLAESPLHYLANVQNKSSNLDKGTGVHSLLLGGKRVVYYDKETASGRAAPRNGKDWETFKALNEDALILSRSEYDVSNRIADAVRSNELAMRALTGAKEETLRFDWHGLPARTTPDCRANDATFVTELKTCRSSRPGRFSSQSFWMWYHAQLAFHIEGMKANGLVKRGSTPDAFIVAVCSVEPFPVTVFKLTEKALEQGRKSLTLWTEQLKNCIASKHFPPYSQTVVELDVPDQEEPLFPGGLTESGDVDF